MNKLRLMVAAMFAVVASMVACGQPTLRILPLGDSITVGTCSLETGGCRGPLWAQLTSAGYAVEFVGTQMTSPTGAYAAMSMAHEGHGGARITDPNGDRLDCYMTSKSRIEVDFQYPTVPVSGNVLFGPFANEAKLSTIFWNDAGGQYFGWSYGDNGHHGITLNGNNGTTKMPYYVTPESRVEVDFQPLNLKESVIFYGAWWDSGIASNIRYCGWNNYQAAAGTCTMQNILGVHTVANQYPLGELDAKRHTSILDDKNSMCYGVKSSTAKLIRTAAGEIWYNC